MSDRFKLEMEETDDGLGGKRLSYRTPTATEFLKACGFSVSAEERFSALVGPVVIPWREVQRIAFGEAEFMVPKERAEDGMEDHWQNKLMYLKERGVLDNSKCQIMMRPRQNLTGYELWALLPNS